jgi:hypothetical protein
VLLAVAAPGTGAGVLLRGNGSACSLSSRDISARTRDSICPGASGVMTAMNRPSLVMKAGSLVSSTWLMMRVDCCSRSSTV